MRILLLVVALTGCKRGQIDVEDPDETDTSDSDTSAEPDPSDALFPTDRLTEVEITLDPADWDALRGQQRDLIDMLTGECLAQPFGDPYTYFPGTVVIDGEEIPEVGVRKKGLLGSSSSTKPGLKIDFGEYVDGGEYLGLEKMTLNNAVQDPAITRQCLGYEVFEAAGVPSPRCAFAHVVVNGEDLGVYAHVDGVDGDFLDRRFEDPDGTLWEGTLSDFRDGWTGTFEQKTHEDVPAGARLLEVVDALGQPDGQLISALEGVVDLDQFLTFWATEVLVGHWDGYAGNTNNFNVYDDPATGRLVFLPWGIDQILASEEPFGPGAPTVVVAQGRLAARLYGHSEGRERYLAALQAVLDGAWREDDVLAEADRMQALVEPYVPDADRDAFLDAQEQLRTFVATRRLKLERELEDPPDLADEPRGSPCLVEIGSIDATFSTTWGTLNRDDPFSTGEADLTLFINGQTIPFLVQGAVAGDLDPGGAKPAGIAIAAAITEDTFVVPYVAFDPTAAFPGAVLPVDAQSGTLLYADPNTGGELVQAAYFGQGTLEIDAFGDTDGDEVSGRFTVPLLGQ